MLTNRGAHKIKGLIDGIDTVCADMWKQGRNNIIEGGPYGSRAPMVA